jgi:hypothetical protein
MQGEGEGQVGLCFLLLRVAAHPGVEQGWWFLKLFVPTARERRLLVSMPRRCLLFLLGKGESADG